MTKHSKESAISRAIEMSVLEKEEWVVYSDDGGQTFNAEYYGNFFYPDSYVVCSFLCGKEIDFGQE